MARGTINQTDIERILRAAAKVGSKVEIDMRSMVVTVAPSDVAFALSEMGQIEGGDEPFKSLAEWHAWKEAERQKETKEQEMKRLGLKAW